MRFPRLWFRLRTPLLLPVAAVLLLMAIDPMAAGRSYLYPVVFKFDVVNARDKHPIPAHVTMTYIGPFAGRPQGDRSYTTHGTPYRTYRGMTPWEGPGGISGVVWHRPPTLIFRRQHQTVVEGVRFQIEAPDYESFSFAPAGATGGPFVCEGWSVPVFRVELRREGASRVPALVHTAGTEVLRLEHSR